MNRCKVLLRAGWWQSKPGRRQTKAASSIRKAILLTFSIPESWCLFPTLLSRAKRGKLGSMNAVASLRHREGNQGVRNPLINLGHLNNKLKNQQQVFTRAASY